VPKHPRRQTAASRVRNASTTGYHVGRCKITLMKFLFVTPNPSGSGEAITAMHMGLQLAQAGHEVRYFAEGFTAAFLREAFESKVVEMSGDLRENVTRWHHLLQAYKPRAIVFADYPLLLLAGAGRALLQHDHGKLLRTLDAELITLDHLGMAQGPVTLSFGPPHLELFQSHFPPVPERMRILLPCPIQRPAVLWFEAFPFGTGIPVSLWPKPAAGRSGSAFCGAATS